MSREVIECPKCGADMNCHAEKPSDPRTRAEAASAQAAAGVMVEQEHTCPNCGAVVCRRTV